MKLIKAFVIMALCMVLAFGLAACGSSSGSGAGKKKSKTVKAFFPTNGANWNDYVQGGDISNATDIACDPDIDTACLHGGEIRVFAVPDKFACDGLTASDTLGAFDWTCEDSTSPVRMVSTGLADGKHLSDLLDFGLPGWKENSITVYDGGTEYFSTSPAAWWTNPVVEDNDGGYLDDAGTIYVVTDDALTPSTGGYIINASSVGLVGQPGVIINGPAAGYNSKVISAYGFSTATDFLWLEGDVDASGDGFGVYLTLVRFSRLDNFKTENAGTDGVVLKDSLYNRVKGVISENNDNYGVTIYDSPNNKLSGITASSNGQTGVWVSYSSDNNALWDVTASNNYAAGVWLDSSSNTLFDVSASNNGFCGVILGSSNNKLNNITAVNNYPDGVYLWTGTNNILSRVTVANNHFDGIRLEESSNNTLSAITAVNNSYGVSLYDNSNNNTLSGVSSANNGRGVELGSSSNNTLTDITTANNYDGVYLEVGYGLGTSPDNNYFTGALVMGSNSILDCSVTAGTHPGLVNSTCSESGYPSGGPGGYGIGNSSDATLTTGIDLSNSFVGRLTSDDYANDSDIDGAADYPLDPASFDWLNFDNMYRGWGLDGTFGNGDSIGDWTSGAGRIWDWSVATGDSVIKDALALPNGDDTLTHLWSAAGTSACGDITGASWGAGVCSLPGYFDQASCEAAAGDWTTDKCYTVFLRNAVELSDDTIGNDNTLCESDETCLFTPNIGSYQGHGNLIDAGYIDTGGTLENITLLEYETNGR